VYVESADSIHVYNNNTDDQLIVSACGRQRRCRPVLSADCARPAGMVYASSGGPARRTRPEPSRATGDWGIRTTAAGAAALPRTTGSTLYSLGRGLDCKRWTSYTEPTVNSRTSVWRLARPAVALCSYSSSSGAWMFCTAVSW